LAKKGFVASASNFVAVDQVLNHLRVKMTITFFPVHQSDPYQIIIIRQALFRPTRKPEAVLRIPTPKSITLRWDLQPQILWNNLASMDETVIATSVLYRDTTKASQQ
jgi:hypothetical protein